MASNGMFLVNNSNNTSLKDLSIAETEEIAQTSDRADEIDSNSLFAPIIIDNGKINSQEEGSLNNTLNYIAKANSMRNLAAKRPGTENCEVKFFLTFF